MFCNHIRSPHIPVVSDRYGLYLFEQKKDIAFAALSTPMNNFDYESFIGTYKLGEPMAANYFVAIYTSVSPFSGKAFHGNDVSKIWHKDYGRASFLYLNKKRPPQAEPKHHSMNL